MKKCSKLFYLLVLVCLLITSLSACSDNKKNENVKEEQTTGKGELTVLLPPWAEPSEEVIKKFENENNVKVNMNIMGWDEIHDKVTIAAVSGKAPADVLEVDWSWANEFHTADCVEPIEMSDEQKSKYPLYTSFEIDGQITAIPYSNDFKVGYYNEEHFKAAGITKAPSTWDELIEDCVKIKEAGVCEYPLSFVLSATEGSATQILWLGLSRSGKIFNEDDSINSESLLDALNFINDGLTKTKIIDPAAVSLTDVEVGNVYLKGNATFHIGSNSTLATSNNPEESSVVGQIKPMLIPRNGNAGTVTYGLPEGVGVSRYSENKEVAKKFVEWFVSKEVQDDLYHKKGITPTNMDVFKELGINGEIEGSEILLEQMKAYQSPFPNGIPTWYSEYSSLVSNNLNAMAQGVTTPEKAADEIADEVLKLSKQK